MSTYFDTVEEAVGYAKAMLGIPGLAHEEVAEATPVGPMFSDTILEEATKEDASREDIAMGQIIVEKMARQRTFRFLDPDGSEHQFPLREPINGKETTTIQITVGPFRSGFDCWLIAEVSPFAHRI